MENKQEISEGNDVGADVANMFLDNWNTKQKKPSLRSKIWALLTGIED